MSPHILLTGGGTLGPVTPLLAIASEWRKRDPHVTFTWIGTPHGPEKMLVEQAKIPFVACAVPKYDRSRWWMLPWVPFMLALSCIRAFVLLRRLEPQMIFSAGAYVSVPFVWVGKLMRIPVWIHQLDVMPGLASTLMAPFAQCVSVTWEEQKTAFGGKKTLVVGGMIRSFLRYGDATTAKELFGLTKEKPTVFVLGGGTGASRLNEAMSIIGPELVRHVNVIHLTGKGKMLSALETCGDGYIAREFFGDGIADVYAAADVVVCRAGMGTITELVALGKRAILLPLPGHQEANAKALEDRGAAEVLWRMTPQTLLQSILRAADRSEKRDRMMANIRSVFPTNGDERIVHDAMKMLEAL
jgi:UDP-N-acetylglucosamine--N-acetylmuramyl-(pentapeptide) pyrophosphoryl-undecaprenol N-acetylglucosamine transferase